MIGSIQHEIATLNHRHRQWYFVPIKPIELRTVTHWPLHLQEQIPHTHAKLGHYATKTQTVRFRLHRYRENFRSYFNSHKIIMVIRMDKCGRGSDQESSKKSSNCEKKKIVNNTAIPLGRSSDDRRANPAWPLAMQPPSPWSSATPRAHEAWWPPLAVLLPPRMRNSPHMEN